MATEAKWIHFLCWSVGAMGTGRAMKALSVAKPQVQSSSVQFSSAQSLTFLSLLHFLIHPAPDTLDNFYCCCSGFNDQVYITTLISLKKKKILLCLCAFLLPCNEDVNQWRRQGFCSVDLCAQVSPRVSFPSCSPLVSWSQSSLKRGLSYRGQNPFPAQIGIQDGLLKPTAKKNEELKCFSTCTDVVLLVWLQLWDILVNYEHIRGH